MRRERTTYLISFCALHIVDRKYLLYCVTSKILHWSLVLSRVYKLMFICFISKGKILGDGFCHKKLSYLGENYYIYNVYSR